MNINYCVLLFIIKHFYQISGIYYFFSDKSDRLADEIRRPTTKLPERTEKRVIKNDVTTSTVVFFYTDATELRQPLTIEKHCYIILIAAYTSREHALYM